MPAQCCSLNGKTAIITGASRGIGKAIAIQLATCGAKISLVARNQHDLDAVQKIINHSGGESQSLIGDVSNFESFSWIVTQTLEKWQKVDILVNNAGTNPYYGDLIDIDLKLVEKIQQVNVVAPLGWVPECRVGGVASCVGLKTCPPVATVPEAL